MPRERFMHKEKRSFGTLRAGLQSKPWGGAAALAVLLFLAAVTLTGCAEPQTITAVEPTATLYPPPPTDVPLPPPGPTPAALDFPLPAPTQSVAEPESDQNCVGCHTDEETLKALATEEEGGQETLSEGEG
jgi:hypothetical protein